MQEISDSLTDISLKVCVERSGVVSIGKHGIFSEGSLEARKGLTTGEAILKGK